MANMKFKILDVACGIDPEGDVNIDITNVSEAFAFKPANFIVASAAHLPFKNKTFETVTCNDLIEHLEDEEIMATLKEIKRVANRAIFKVPNAYFTPSAWKYSWTILETHYRQVMRRFPHKQIFDETMLKGTLGLVFKHVEVKGWGCWIDIPVLRKILALFSPRIPFLGQMLIAYCENE